MVLVSGAGEICWRVWGVRDGVKSAEDHGAGTRKVVLSSRGWNLAGKHENWVWAGRRAKCDDYPPRAVDSAIEDRGQNGMDGKWAAFAS